MSHLSVVPEQQPQLTAPAARQLTDKIKADAEHLWAQLLDAYERGAHLALGFTSWSDYCQAEFGTSRTRSYQLLDAGRVAKAIESQSTMVESRPSERAARQLAPTLKAEGEEAVAQAWEEAVEQHGPNPTAAEVKATMEKKPPPERPKLTAEQERFARALSSMELGAEYVGAHIRRVDLDVDQETLAEWQRQSRVINNVSMKLRRRFAS